LDHRRERKRKGGEKAIVRETWKANLDGLHDSIRGGATKNKKRKDKKRHTGESNDREKAKKQFKSTGIND